jgi:N6-adenosine-specific RNA methylase IME4
VLSSNALGPFSVLVADLPWKVTDQPPGGGAEKHYPLMSTPEICEFGLPQLAENCWLFLWKVTSMQREALDVCEAWGFRPVQELVWLKTSKRGTPRIGNGWYARPMHEFCILAVRGSRPTDGYPAKCCYPLVVQRGSGPSLCQARDLLSEVERLCRGPYVEPFARCHRRGWHCLGNEVEMSCRLTSWWSATSRVSLRQLHLGSICEDVGCGMPGDFQLVESCGLELLVLIHELVVVNASLPGDSFARRDRHV